MIHFVFSLNAGRLAHRWRYCQIDLQCIARYISLFRDAVLCCCIWLVNFTSIPRNYFNGAVVPPIIWLYTGIMKQSSHWKIQSTIGSSFGYVLFLCSNHNTLSKMRFHCDLCWFDTICHLDTDTNRYDSDIPHILKKNITMINITPHEGLYHFFQYFFVSAMLSVSSEPIIVLASNHRRNKRSDCLFNQCANFGLRLRLYFLGTYGTNG